MTITGIALVCALFAQVLAIVFLLSARAHYRRTVAVANAEIADLTRRLHWFTSYTPCHWTRTEIEYRTDCGQIAGPVSKVPDGKCNGCGRQIVVSVPA